ncbi:BUD32 family EKC/KEOPS complex subunit [Spirosoma aerolatum]|uniref:hypothetical protein n=1 Tax=Spirosoma aerolatum TaxID=1211326 RepID=UPI0009AD42BC|nr:hypothetical protein [Spirosoma aerolatum]
MNFHYSQYSSKILAYGRYGVVVALNEKEVAKIAYTNSRSSLELEANNMKFANEINDLVVKFVDLRQDEAETNLLVMERLYPLQHWGVEIETRQKFTEEFKQKLTELHSAGFVFNDFNRTVVKSSRGQIIANNVILTSDGIRLVDTGLSMLKDDIGSACFKEAVSNELGEMESVCKYFLQGFYYEDLT